MRIGIVHAGWPLQTLIRELVNGLAAQGHDLYLVATAQDDRGMVDLGAFSGEVELVPAPRFLGKADRRIRRWLATVLPGRLALQPPWVRRRVGRALARRGRHDLLIGVEKAGLELAAWWGALSGTRFVYYSLELYLPDHPGRRGFAWQWPRERACHARASGTIIQDRHRWEALRAANGIADQPVYFLPVGAAAAAREATPLAPARAMSTRSPFTLLSFGMQGPGRYTRELIAAAAALPAEFALHLHGPVYDAPTRRLAEGTLPPNVRYTTRVLPESELPDLLASADVGLALYRCDSANDRLTAYSSQKVALYLRCGLPLITFRNDAYADLFSRFRCGEMVDDLAELGVAARRILDDYPSYSAAACAAFTGIYHLDRYWEGLSRFLQACAAPPGPAGVG
jgi:glycosyltransferase involved in cell wall biosynthesis